MKGRVEALPGRIRFDLVFPVAFAIAGSCAAATNHVLATAAEILSLPADHAARGIAVSISGIVTVAESNWKGRFFVQDSTGGVFVNNESEPGPVPGDLVQVSGASHIGGYAPDIIRPHWKKLGTASLPEPRRVSVDRLMCGAEDGQRVEVCGAVRSAQTGDAGLELELVSGGYRFRVLSLVSTNLNPNSLVGATLRVRGTAAAIFNFPTRQLLNVVLFVPQQSDFIIDQPPDAAVSREPFTPLNGVTQYRRNNSPAARIRVQGVVTYQRPGNDIFLHDETGGLQVKCRETNSFAAGEIVEAIGFPVVEGFLPALQDAILSRKNRTESPVVPQKVSLADLLEGRHHSDVVSVQGKLLDRSLRSLRTADLSGSGTNEHVLTLQSSNILFSVEAPATSQFAGLASIPIGSTLEVSGICLLQARDANWIETIQLLPLEAASIRILQRPGWWTPERTRLGFGIFVAVSLVGAGVLYGLHRIRLARMSARMNLLVETQSKERKRIAQELHDTLLQGFTGIGLKLDAVTHSLPPSLTATKEQLQNLLERSDEYLIEARRAVWKLRSPSLEDLNDLSEALKKVSERAIQGSGIRLYFRTSGAARKLPEAVEDNLLRICEEGVANAAMHARPTKVEVVLEYTSNQLRLRVRDDGCGFDPGGLDGAMDGHFGLMGIRDRAKSMGGSLTLNSKPGHGTEIIVTVRLNGSG
jgi:signal transduction histidine kinase